MKVLIIDDDEPVRMLARVYAEDESACDVFEAGNGPAALRHAQRTRFDLVVVDYHLPGMDGLEITRALLEIDPNLEIVAWTSTLDPAVEQAFIEAGARCRIPKTDTDVLRRVIRERHRETTSAAAPTAA